MESLHAHTDTMLGEVCGVLAPAIPKCHSVEEVFIKARKEKRLICVSGGLGRIPCYNWGNSILLQTTVSSRVINKNENFIVKKLLSVNVWLIFAFLLAFKTATGKRLESGRPPAGCA